LKGLTKEDLFRILTEPESNLLKQNIELLKTEGCELSFTNDAIEEIARVSFEINSTIENTGARRLHTVVEKVIEDYSFIADELDKIEITKEIVQEKVGSLLKKTDLKQFIL
jgi:ATP-dependent HslUV protease ATP-binding subunit HslU